MRVTMTIDAPPDYARLEAFAIDLAKAAGAAALPLFRLKDQGETNKLAHMAQFDPVTEADKGAERAMRALINQHFPDHGIIGEEYGTQRAEADFVWVLDPVDGTRAFISGLPLWTTLIGLRFKGRAVLGVIAQPFLNEIYIGSPLGSRLVTPAGERVLRVRACAGLDKALLATTDPFLFKGPEWDAVVNLRKASRLIRYGCDAYAFAMVAGGTLDGAFETGLMAWDIDAIIPVIENAGGVVVNWKGEPVGNEGGQVFAAVSRELAEAALTHLSPAAL
jgi:histidinol phosphatase-like enzyme (inositol monophosphatase family)